MVTDTAHLKRLVQGNSAFALDLYHAVRNTCPGNLFFSPFSISSCLAMALLGAKGDTASQIVRCLRLEGEGHETHTRLAALQQTLLRDGDKRHVELRTANKLWSRAGLRVLSQFLESADQFYHGGFQEVDFGNSQKAAQLINDWVSKETNAMIPSLVTDSQVSGALFVITNAIYFHGKWSAPFEREATLPRLFYLSSGEGIEVPMMRQCGPGWYARVHNLQILEKWYGEGEFSMVIFLPDRHDGLEELEATLRFQKLNTWLSMLQEKDEIDIQVPKFRIKSAYSLRSSLIEMGIEDAFNPAVADFSGITGNRDLFVNEAIHEAVIEVEEEGTKAAAVTALKLIMGIADHIPKTIFHADHPFLFLIRHNPSKTILFLGRVIDPR